MGLEEWLRAFRDLHERFKKSGLTGRDLEAYQNGREELAKALLAAQHVALQANQKPRRALRVARALQIELMFSSGSVRALTFDLSVDGFSALLASPPHLEEKLKIALRLPGAEVLQAEARVVAIQPQTGSVRVGFSFCDLTSPVEERLECFVFDAVLDQLKK